MPEYDRILYSDVDVILAEDMLKWYEATLFDDESVAGHLNP